MCWLDVPGPADGGPVNAPHANVIDVAHRFATVGRRQRHIFACRQCSLLAARHRALGETIVIKPLRKAVLPVAGLGTRFLPATKAIAKEMLPVVDKPLIQYSIEEARAAGIEQFCLVTGRGKTALVEHFDVAFELEATLRERGKSDALELLRATQVEPGSMVTVRQQVPLGLGHAIWCARAFIGDDPFAILLPDDLVLADTPCLRQLADIYRDTGGNVVAVTEVPRDQTNRYGILRTGKDDGRLVEVLGLVEKPAPKDAPSNLSIIGRYVLMPEVIAHLARMERGAGNEVQLTDGMAKLIGQQPFHGLRYEGQRFDCGDKIGYLEAQIAYALKRPDIADAVRGFLRHYVDPTDFIARAVSRETVRP
jgi:UTP--glucose-1-phosphate uridylyltransferase